MDSILKNNIREDFLIRLYFDTSEGFEKAGIKRAFLDLSRTLPIKDRNRREFIENSKKLILDKLFLILNKVLTNQQEFDLFHKKSCEHIISEWNELSIGQAQKWINMTLKYWLLFGEDRIPGIELNAKLFHIPIDRYIQKEMLEVRNKSPWSKINSYDEYMEYQIIQRQKRTGNPPIIDEFIFFNNYNPKNKKS